VWAANASGVSVMIDGIDAQGNKHVPSTAWKHSVCGGG